MLFCCRRNWLYTPPPLLAYTSYLNRVSDPHHCSPDAEPAFHLYVDPDPDQAFHFNVDPDPDPAPHQGDANLRPLAYRPFRTRPPF
jgi:hypothetical protein